MKKGNIKKTKNSNFKFGNTLFGKIWHHKNGKIGIIVLTIVILITIFAFCLTPYDPYAYDITKALQKPSTEHWLGTDQNGVDILTQILYGGRLSLLIGIATGLGCTFFGALLGIVAGYFGKVASSIILNSINVLMVIPTLPLMIVMHKVSSSYLMMIFIFIMFGWSGIARLVRSQVLNIRNMEYIKQAELNGASKFYIMRRHILPGIANLLIMNTALSCAGFMIAEAGLSFMGLGDPSKISWGKMLVAAQEYAYSNSLWLWIIAPGIALVIVVVGFMNIGYALEEICNPRSKKVKDNFKMMSKLTQKQIEEAFKEDDENENI